MNYQQTAPQKYTRRTFRNREKSAASFCFSIHYSQLTTARKNTAVRHSAGVWCHLSLTLSKPTQQLDIEVANIARSHGRRGKLAGSDSKYPTPSRGALAPRGGQVKVARRDHVVNETLRKLTPQHENSQGHTARPRNNNDIHKFQALNLPTYTNDTYYI